MKVADYFKITEMHTLALGSCLKLSGKLMAQIFKLEINTMIQGSGSSLAKFAWIK